MQHRNVLRTEIALVLLLALSYFYVFPRWSDPNVNSRLNMVIAVVEDGTFRIDPYVHNTVDYAKIGDHYYSDKAPGIAFLGIPVYAAFYHLFDLPVVEGFTARLADSAAFQSSLREDGSGVSVDKVRFALAQVLLSWLLATLPTLGIGILIFRLLLLLGIGPRLAFVGALSYGLLTPAFAYATALYGHQLSAFLVFLAFYLALRHIAMTSVRLLLIGLLLGYSVVTEYPVVLLAGVVFLFVLYRLYRFEHWYRIGWVVLSGLVVAAGWMVYNTLIFGGPLELGYSHSTLWLDKHQTGFMSLTLPHAEALWGITFSEYRGLFFLAPWLLLALPGAVIWWRSRNARAVWWSALGCVIAMFLFNGASVMWWGGFAVGPRYLLPTVPFLSLFAVFGMGLLWRQPWRRAAVILVLLWSLIAVWGLTLAEQAFPPDTIFRPFVEFVWPNWAMGNIARNWGTLLGLQGISSLVPLIVSLVAILALYGWITGTGSRKIDKLSVTTNDTATVPQVEAKPVENR